jgi:phospholipase/carboxylesterase
MNYRTIDSSSEIVLEPSHAATASVIWLHGLGADGHDFVPIVPELRLPPDAAIRFVFPHAAVRSVTINNGYEMRAWYDIKALALSGPEDDAGIRESDLRVRQYVSREIKSGIAAERIVIAGFSQGGAIALQTGLRYPERLAGIMALSTYLPLRGSLGAELSDHARTLPILMCHGRSDNVVPIVLGSMSRDVMLQNGVKVAWHEYPMQHEVSMPEIADISAWLISVLR